MAPKKTTTTAASNAVNPLESLKALSNTLGGGSMDSLKNIGGGIFDQLLGVGNHEDTENDQSVEKQLEAAQKETKKVKKEANLFTYQNHHETVVVKEQIKQLVEEIHKEIEYIKKADKSLLSEVRDIEKLTMETVSEKPGIYHVKFLEIVLRILRSVRMKVGESRTWLQAMVSKKKKRGSLFAARSKKQGTAYSMSQELSNARSIQ